MSDELLSSYLGLIESAPDCQWRGRVSQVVGNIIESEGPLTSLGECCEILCGDGTVLAAEVVGFRGPTVLSMTLQRLDGIRFGDTIVSTGQTPSFPVGDQLLGRVLDALGLPLDGGGRCRAIEKRAIDGSAPLPYGRLPISEPLSCGVRAIDGFLSCGRGQRLGIFGGSGVGKTTLIGMLTRGAEADVIVLALVGERGREVREFVEQAIGAEGMLRSVVIVSTSDQSPLLRLRAALAATTVAEHFSAQGKHVLLVLDSLTRFAMAQREIGLAAGEPPTAKGYTPSVFSMLARLVERAGNFERGSITGFYTVLMEGDDQQDPIVDSVRSFLDGHIVLDRKLAAAGHFPPIQVLDSLSRLAVSVSPAVQVNAARELRALLSTYNQSQDLVRIGAYQKGADAMLDRAVALMPGITEFLRQGAAERTSLHETRARMVQLAGV